MGFSLFKAKAGMGDIFPNVHLSYPGEDFMIQNLAHGGLCLRFCPSKYVFGIKMLQVSRL